MIRAVNEIYTFQYYYLRFCSHFTLSWYSEPSVHSYPICALILHTAGFQSRLYTVTQSVHYPICTLTPIFVFNFLTDILAYITNCYQENDAQVRNMISYFWAQRCWPIYKLLNMKVYIYLTRPRSCGRDRQWTRERSSRWGPGRPSPHQGLKMCFWTTGCPIILVRLAAI